MKIIWILTLLLTCSRASFAANPSYHQPIEIIDKNQVDYLTPENTMSALKSALLSENLPWADETITRESLQEQIQLFEKANIARYQLFELERKSPRFSRSSSPSSSLRHPAPLHCHPRALSIVIPAQAGIQHFETS